MSNEDYFDFDFAQLTDEDYARIDALSANCSPIIEVALESEPVTVPEPGPSSERQSRSPKKPDTRSLFQRFRRRGVFSVSDLIEPAWCEVKKEYDLRGSKWRGATERPSTFQSANDKTITVDQGVSQHNDRVMKQGEEIHKKLERQVSGVEVRVDIESIEDRQGLLMMRMISDLVLLKLGSCREFPVFGRINGYLVRGVIDEIRRVELTPPDSQDQQSSNVKTRTHALFLSDTKTRTHPSMPPERNSQSSKFQVMLYKRLLDALMSRAEPFDFVNHWESLGCDPTKPFSDLFRAQIELLTGASGMEANIASATCLVDTIPVWIAAVEDLGIGQAVEDDLSLVYVLQAKYPAPPSHSPQEARTRSNTGSEALGGIPSEELQVALAIEQSLFMESGSAPVTSEQAGDIDLQAEDQMLMDDEMIVIGTRQFAYDAQLLEAYLDDVLEFWTGKRPARGVSEEDARRCNSCEYAPNCEWREQRGLEALAAAHARRGVQRHLTC